jgi:hypothetical protein
VGTEHLYHTFQDYFIRDTAQAWGPKYRAHCDGGHEPGPLALPGWKT